MSLLLLLTAPSFASGDYNCDGIDDLVLGSPYWDNGDLDDEGRIDVLLGSTSGVTLAGEDWTVYGSGREFQAGLDFAHGDLSHWYTDDDGCDELLFAGLSEWRGYQGGSSGLGYYAPDSVLSGAGRSVAIGAMFSGNLYVASGYDWEVTPETVSLFGANDFDLSYTLSQDTSGVSGTKETSDIFGYDLAYGDFDGDGYDDLAVGVPYENWYATDDGAVHVFYGGATAGDFSDDQLWSQDTSGVPGTAASNDHCGWSVVTGDFNADGYDDLAYGCPYDDEGGPDASGAVVVLYGSSAGLTATGSQLWHQDSTGIAGVRETSDHFGYSLASGRINRGRSDDLVIGVPTEAYYTTGDGVVQVLYGSATGVSSNDQLLTWTANANDAFGSSVAVGDWNGDGRHDVAAGIPGYDESGGSGAGAVRIMYSTGSQISTTNQVGWTMSDVIGTTQAGAQLGTAIH